MGTKIGSFFLALALTASLMGQATAQSRHGKRGSEGRNMVAVIVLYEEKESSTAKRYSDDAWIVDFMRSHRLTDSEVETLREKNPDWLVLLRNTPYAAQGYRFHRADLRDFYNNFSWYRGTVSDAADAERWFSRTERNNISTIVRHEKRH